MVEPQLPVAHLEPPKGVTPRILWRYAVPIVLIHVLAFSVCLPWLFSWTGALLLIPSICFFGGYGIIIGYHRLLTHRSFKTPRWLEHSMVITALCCMEDTPAIWVATHRLHHNESDETPDPHSPLVSFFWSHVGWLLVENRDIRCLSAYDRYARDILRDPFYMRLQRGLLFFWIYVIQVLLFFLAGLLPVGLASGNWLAGVQFGLSLVAWCVILRTVCVWHITWSVNSLTHLFGYQNHETGDGSRNNWFVALLTSGEGWHNNHHFDQASASNWYHWWEVDLIYAFIRGLELCGLATDVVRPRHQRR